MKKKIGKNKLDNDLDLGLDEGLEDDIDFGELEDLDDDRSANTKLGIAKELTKEAGKGFLTGLAKKTAEKALPDSYNNNYGTALDYADFAKETFDVHKNKINKSIYRLGKEVKKILPFQSRMLDKFLERYETDFDEFKSQTEEQMRDAGIASNLGSIFDKQLEVQKAFEVKRSAETDVDRKQQLSMGKANLDTLTSIDNNLSTQTAFTLQVSKEYFRKSLELQYKSYYIQADMLKTIRDYYKGFSLQFDNIIKNTGLPDFVKLNTSESVKEIARRQLVENAQRRLFTNNEYINKVKNRMSTVISDKVSGITDAIDNATDMLGNINMVGEGNGGGVKLLSSVLAGLGGATLGEKLSAKISPKLKEKIANNKTINTGANYLQMLAASPASFFANMKERVNKKSEEYSDESNPIRFLASKLFSGMGGLLDVTDPGKQEYTVEKSSILNHSKPAIFDNNVHRSITEVIPLYLSKILSEQTNLRSMYRIVNSSKLTKHTDSDSLVYDYEARDLTTKEKFVENIQKSVLGKQDNYKIKDIGSSISNLAISAGVKNKISNEDLGKLKNKKMQKDFENYIYSASKTLGDNKFTFDEVINNSSSNKDLSAILDGNEDLQKYIDVLKRLNMKEVNTITDRMQDVKRVYPIIPIIELFKGASKLALSDYTNEIDKDTATIIAKGFTIYLNNTGTEITLSKIVNTECFSFITDVDIDKITPNLKIFITESTIINNSDDIVRQSSMEALLGIVCTQLREVIVNDPSMFQELYNISPLLQRDGKLTVENLVESKLGKFNDKEYADRTKLRELRSKDYNSVRKDSEERTKTGLISKIENSALVNELGKYGKILTKYKEGISGAKDFKEMVNSSMTLFDDVLKQSKETGSRIYSSANTKLNNLNKLIPTLAEKNLEKAKLAMLKNLDNYIEDINKAIAEETAAKEEVVKKLNFIKQTVSENLNNQSNEQKMDADIEKLVKHKERNIKLLNDYIKIIISARKSIYELSTNDLKTFISSSKSVLLSLKNKAINILPKEVTESIA